jgi:nucleoside-diphosphate-sugar epimerase
VTLQEPASAAGVVLITGATGYIGGRLVSVLEGMAAFRFAVSRKAGGAGRARADRKTEDRSVVTDPAALTTFPVRPVGLREAIARAILASPPEHRRD